MENLKEFQFPPSLCPYKHTAKNPHINQFNDVKIVNVFNPLIEQDFRLLSQEAPRESYQRKAKDIISVCSNAKKRDVLSYIEFLTNTSCSNVVFNRSISDSVVQVLASMFQDLTFYVYNSFSDVDDGNIKTFQKPCEQIEDSALIYVKEYRNTKKASVEEQNQRFLDILKEQRQIIQEQKPKYFLLPFQLPWTKEKYEFFKGTLFIPPFGSHSQSELYLHGSDYNEMQQYDAEQLEQQMFYFNQHTRGTLYNHHLTVGGESKFFSQLDCCFDCTSELYILIQYCLKIKKYNGVYEVLDLNDIYERIEKLCYLQKYNKRGK